jgi:hypothetical protein
MGGRRMGNRLNSMFDLKEKPFTYPEMEERILQKYPEIAEMRKLSDPMNIVQMVDDYIMEHLKTAVDKEFVSDLISDEASAICYFAGANGTWVDGKMRFENVGLYKRDGKWGVMQYDRRY